MPYVSSFERLARMEGLEQGLEQGRVEALQDAIIDTLELRFETSLQPDVTTLIREIKTVEVLRQLQRTAIRAGSLEDVLQELHRPSENIEK